MKKFKSLISLGLAAAMTVSAMTGCNNAGTSDNGGESAGEDTIVLGSSGPLTGNAASYGTSVKQGAEIAIEEINAAGGVLGKQLELKFYDDECNEEKALTAYNKCVDDGMVAFMGCVTSGTSLAVAPESANDGILLLTPSGSSEDITNESNAFRICFTDPLQGVTMADYAMNTLGYSKIAVIYDVSDAYSSGMRDAFEAQVAANGGQIVASESFTSGDVDFNTQLTKIASTDAEVIFLPIYYTEVGYITSQAAKAGMTIPFIGGDGWDGVLDQVEDPATVEGSIFLSPFTADDTSEKVQAFVATYNEKYSARPDQFAADGYDAVYVIKNAIETAGSTDKQAIIDAMTQVSFDGLTGNMSFDVNGEPIKEAKTVIIQDGKYVAQ